MLEQESHEPLEQVVRVADGIDGGGVAASCIASCGLRTQAGDGSISAPRRTLGSLSRTQPRSGVLAGRAGEYRPRVCLSSGLPPACFFKQGSDAPGSIEKDLVEFLPGP